MFKESKICWKLVQQSHGSCEEAGLFLCIVYQQIALLDVGLCCITRQRGNALQGQLLLQQELQAGWWVAQLGAEQQSAR